MRYITSQEENWTWVLLTACWASGALLGWGYSLLAEHPPLADGILLLISAVVAVTGLALRLPILTDAPHSDQRWDHVVMLTGYLATINWLGLIMLHASGLVVACVALMIVASAEIWLLFHYFLYGCLRLAPLQEDHRSCAAEQRSGDDSVTLKASFADQTQSENLSWAHASLNAEQTSGASLDTGPASEVREDAEIGLKEAEGLLRRSVEGVDEEGSRYLSGEVLVQLQAQEATQEVMLGFCPPFVGNPLLEFEVSDEHVSASMIRLSPAGACLRLRRISSSGDSQPELRVELQWYAVQPSQPQLPAPALP